MFVIRAADNQPKIDSNARNLEQINDHCLLNVMSKLQLLDVVNLSRTSIRMRSVCDIYFKKFAHFSYRTSTGDDSSITDRNLPIILEQIGRHITSIEWVKLNDEEFELLARFCPNVTKITLSSMKNVNTTLLNQNKQFFGKLTQLCVKASGHLSDRGIRAMTSGGKVRTIDIQDCSRTLGKFVLLLHRNKLKSFTFLHGRQRVPYDKCFAIDTWKAKLVKFCCDVPGSISLLSSKSKSLEHLKELHLDFSTLSHDLQTLNFSDLKNIQEVTLTRSNASNHYNTWFRTTPVNANDLINAFSQCPTLQSLSIHMIIIDDATIGALTRLQNLKQLKLTRVDNTIGQSLYKLALALPRLQKVAISFDDPSTEFTNGHLISKFVASMPMLTEFYHELVRFSWLDKIIVARGNNDPPILRVGLPKHMMYDVRKVSLQLFFSIAISLIFYIITKYDVHQR